MKNDWDKTIYSNLCIPIVPLYCPSVQEKCFHFIVEYHSSARMLPMAAGTTEYKNFNRILEELLKHTTAMHMTSAVTITTNNRMHQ